MNVDFEFRPNISIHCHEMFLLTDISENEELRTNNLLLWWSSVKDVQPRIKGSRVPVVPDHFISTCSPVQPDCGDLWLSG
jgi:hypothetical protein